MYIVSILRTKYILLYYRLSVQNNSIHVAEGKIKIYESFEDGELSVEGESTEAPTFFFNRRSSEEGELSVEGESTEVPTCCSTRLRSPPAGCIDDEAFPVTRFIDTARRNNLKDREVIMVSSKFQSVKILSLNLWFDREDAKYRI